MDLNRFGILVALFGLVALFALLAWVRFLRNKETLRLLDKGGDWHGLLELRERDDRWRIRWGILVGAVLLLVGAIGVLMFVFFPRHQFNRAIEVLMGGAVWIGFLPPHQFNANEDLLPFCLVAGTAGIGLVLLVAHLIWARTARARSHWGQPIVPNTDDSENPENRM